MSKPSIAELLNASGHTVYTPELVQRAMYSLYGNIGANLDERDWSAIMQSANPLQASEDALRVMYQDSAYLLRNTQHLTQSGYVAAQAEITYRQMAGRLDYTYNPAWSDGTPYDYLGDLTYEQLVSLVPAPPPPPPLPTISVSASATGFSVALNVAGTVKLSVSGDLGNFAAGSTLLTEQGSVKEGFLTLAANRNTSAATSQYAVLGTGGDNTIDATAAGSRVDYIFGGAGNDTIRGGQGNDILLGGTGNDTIYGNEDDDLIYGGEGNDNLTGSAGADTFNVDAGTDTVTDLSGSDVLVVSAGAIANASVTAHFIATAATSNAGVANLKLADGVNADLSLATGPVGYNITADRNTSASRIVGSEFADDIYGGNVNDTIIAGAGDDIIRGGAGADTIDTGTGTNTIIVGGSGAIAGGESYTGRGTDTLSVTGATVFGGVTVIDSIETILLAAGVSATFEAAALTGDTIAVNGTGDNGQESLIVRGTAGNDTINLGGLTLDTNDIVGASINGLGGDNVITGTNGGDTITGGVNTDTITGKAGADAIYLGSDASADTVRADEGDGQMLVAGEIAHLDSDRVEQFNATHDKFVVSGAGTSVILGGVAATQTAGTTFQNVAFGTFDLNGTVGGAYITMAAVGSLRAFSSVQSVIGALANESVGEEAYFVLRDGIGGGNAGVYHFRSVTANGVVDVGEIELLGLILAGVGSNLTGLGAANFVFA